MVRKALSTPSIDFFLTDHPQKDALVLILIGHLSIEYLLIEIIGLRYTNKEKAWKLNFPQKADKCVELDFISEDMAEGLKAYNSLRNDLAHILGYKFTFSDVFDLAGKVARAGFVFTDDTIWLDRKLAQEWYGMNGVINEVTKNIYLDLALVLRENGGEDYMNQYI